MPDRYDLNIEPDAVNSPHAMQLRMVGWNKRVLELGAAGGHMTRALAARQCAVTAVERDAEAATKLIDAATQVVVGDLNDPSTFKEITGPFDVVLAGDVLEHLLDPAGTLRRAVDLLAPDGRVVVSLPNIAHADVRLSLLQGRFNYTPTGLLDETHIRFFTIESVQSLARQAGLLIVEMDRTRFPVFGTEQAVDPSSVPDEVLQTVTADPEHQTYQFVFTAVRDTGKQHVARMSAEYAAISGEVESLRRSIRHEQERRHLLEQQVRRLRRRLKQTQLERDRLKSSTGHGLVRRVSRRLRGR